MAVRFSSIPVSQLQLDLANPRFGLSEATNQEEALQYLLQRSDLKELWDSFAQKGFEPFEPLIGVAAPEKTWKDKTVEEFTIVEGNRRLAAVKTMLDPSLISSISKKSVPELPSEHRQSLLNLPVYVVDRREDAYDYIGFKHINGPSSWGSLAKAKFGVLLFDERRGKGTDDEILTDLSKRLGDTPSQALRTLVAYKIFEQAIQLELVDDPASAETQVDFSHLYTMLPNPGTRKYLGLGEQPLRPEQISDNPIPPTHIDKLGHLMRWLFGDEKRDPVIQRQGTDRPKLQKVLSSDVATQTLEETGDFEQAVQQAGFAKENWMSNVVKLQSLSKTVFSSISEMSEPLSPEERENAITRLTSTIQNVERTTKVI